MDGTKVKDALGTCPPPVRKWEHFGFSDAVLDTIKKLDYKCPFSIQVLCAP